ncbi:hypothetical protein IW261DRAFT_1416599 [Armillaria novae-zelandiae]|uniref:Uncharacterized protein n=1 Tax=Armillaria novae-zelandiae TaxID=153914 RepID=A0AA39PIU8_9AGAR|nr:hypothetical protein IW261DRAFT_1416599 [Armillaria novae-zelandiae]
MANIWDISHGGDKKLIQNEHKEISKRSTHTLSFGGGIDFKNSLSEIIGSKKAVSIISQQQKTGFWMPSVPFCPHCSIHNLNLPAVCNGTFDWANKGRYYIKCLGFTTPKEMAAGHQKMCKFFCWVAKEKAEHAIFQYPEWEVHDFIQCQKLSNNGNDSDCDNNAWPSFLPELSDSSFAGVAVEEMDPSMVSGALDLDGLEQMLDSAHHPPVGIENLAQFSHQINAVWGEQLGWGMGLTEHTKQRDQILSEKEKAIQLTPFYKDGIDPELFKFNMKMGVRSTMNKRSTSIMMSTWFCDCQASSRILLQTSLAQQRPYAQQRELQYHHHPVCCRAQLKLLQLGPPGFTENACTLPAVTSHSLANAAPSRTGENSWPFMWAVDQHECFVQVEALVGNWDIKMREVFLEVVPQATQWVEAIWNQHYSTWRGIKNNPKCCRRSDQGGKWAPFIMKKGGQSSDEIY